MREKTNKINLYKIKPNLSFDEISDTPDGYTKEFEDSEKILFIQANKTSVPSWVNYVKNYISSNVRKIINSNSSFILLQKHDSNIYALTGGYGHNKIKDNIVEDFQQEGVEFNLHLEPHFPKHLVRGVFLLHINPP